MSQKYLDLESKVYITIVIKILIIKKYKIQNKNWNYWDGKVSPYFLLNTTTLHFQVMRTVMKV